MWIAIGFTGALSVALAALAPWILKIYQLTPQTEGLAAEILRWHALLAVLFWVPSFTLPNTLRAAGDVIWSMVIAIVSMWVFRIGFAYIFSFYFDGGLLGVWIAMTIDWAFRGICYGLRYHGHKWERLV